MQLSNESIMHLAGIPATGKSSFGRYLAREYGFVHYDLECFPRGWPVPSFHEVWASSPYEFARRALSAHSRVAIDWGFPVGCLNIVDELKKAGARLVWFTGDITHARLLFVSRGGIPVENFDSQVTQIKAANLPAALEATVVEELKQEGGIRAPQEIFAEVFGAHKT